MLSYDDVNPLLLTTYSHPAERSYVPYAILLASKQSITTSNLLLNYSYYRKDAVSSC